MSTKYFIYEWLNIRTGKRYIGSHKGTIHDGYVGSGVYFKRAYELEPHNFVRTIIEYCNDYDQMKQREAELLLAVDAASNGMYYNLTNLSSGGNLHQHLPEEYRSCMYEKLKEASIHSRLHMTEEQRRQIRLKKQSKWNEPGKREKHAAISRKRRLEEEQQKTKHDRLAFKQTCKDAYWNRDPSAIANQHKKISDSVKRSYDDNPELRKQRSDHFSHVNKGRRFVNKDGITKRVVKEELEDLLAQGWKLGMAKRKDRD